jgi:hypothetical protein
VPWQKLDLSDLDRPRLTCPRGGALTLAEVPDMSNVAPVQKEQSSEQSHIVRAATSSAVPSRFMGLFWINPRTSSGDS